jgi:tRNA (adenine57-N1/adenine58-N1)-methyltransferase catalytic subunit
VQVKASTKGAMGAGFMYMLPPTPDLWTIALPHRTQILYSADICLVVANLELKPGCTVVESGTGSGSLSSSLARAVAPLGKLYTFEFNEMRVEKAKEDFAMTGVDQVTTVTHRNVLEDGFTLPGTDLESSADAVFLDLPSPWNAVQHAKHVLKAGGRLCNFSPCIEQVQQASEKMRELGFSEVRTFEILIRQFDVKVAKPEVGKKRKSREEFGQDGNSQGKIVTKAFPEMKGHTGYLTFASLKTK